MAGLHETKYMRIFPIQEMLEGGVVFAVQPHREVGPGSWLVKAYRIMTPVSHKHIVSRHHFGPSLDGGRGNMEVVV